MLNKEVITQIQKFEIENKCIVVFGMAQGSYMKGIETVNSDYDFRFYYLKRDFIDHIVYPENAVDRLYIALDNKLIKNKICDMGFFEMSMFLNFLITPSINHLNKDYGLYMEICSAFTNPYVWDKFGVRGIIFPVLETLFRPDFLIRHHLIKLHETKDKTEILKININRLFRALSIDWIIKYRRVPPVYMKALLINADEKIREKARELIDKYKNTAEVSMKKLHAGSNQRISGVIDPLIEKYIQEQTISGKLFLRQNNCDFDENSARNMLNSAFAILDDIIQNLE